MDTVFLGQSGLRVSKLGFGTMSFGGDANEATSRSMFERCREAGINLFDCANVYNKGDSERILGRLIKGCRDDVVITTKAYFPTGTGPNDRGSSRYHLIRAVEASLKRLDTDRIDIFFMHRYDDVTPLEETLSTLDILVRQGKILYLGVSNFSAWQTAKAIGIAKLNGWTAPICTQPMYNLVKRQAEVEIFPMAESEGLGVVPYGPLGGGLLTGKYGPELRPTTGRLVDNPMYSIRYSDPDVYQTAKQFCALAHDRGIHPVTLAVAWALNHPAVTAPLIGGRSVEQIEPALAAVNISMDAHLRREISALSRTPSPATDRNEETSQHNYGSR